MGSLQNPIVRFTRIVAPKNDRLTKALTLDGGVLHKDSSPNLYRGRAVILERPLGEILDGIAANACHVYGTFAGAVGAERILTTKERRGGGRIARCREDLCFDPCFSGVLMLDHDPRDAAVPAIPALSEAELIDALAAIFPPFAEAARLVTASASAGIHRKDTGELVHDSRGAHVYFAVKNPADIPRFGAALVKRLWLEGRGGIVIAKNGALLERTIIDETVFQPERVDYAAPAMLSPNLERRAAPPSFTSGGYLDTERLSDLSEAEESEYRRIVNEARRAAKPQADEVRAAAIESSAHVIAEKQGIALEAARTIATAAVGAERADLFRSFFPLTFARHGAVSVADVFADPSRFDGEALADPIEGPDYGRTTAKMFWNGGEQPIVHSMAHGGGRTFFLHNHDQVVIEPVTTENDVTNVTAVTPTAGAASGCNGTERPDVTAVTNADQPEPEQPEPGPPDPEAPESPIPALSARPRFIVLDDWHTVGERRYRPGTWYFGAKQQKDGSLEPVEQWLCSPLRIEAVTRDSQANNIGRLLRFKTTLGQLRGWAMPCELLAGDGVDLRRELLAMGVELDPLSRNLFAQYLNTPPPKRRIHCALSVGWTADGSFVLPDQVIGPQAANVIYQSTERADGEYTTGGTLDGWRSAVAAHAIGNPLLAVALAAAFAGPLLARCHLESGGVHIVGDSSSGKSTALECACSVWGGAGFKKSWRATANGLEAVAALHSDNLLPLDEISEADGRDIGAVVYMIGNGRGKARATRTGRARAVTRWRTFLLSTGERGIEASMSEAGHRIKQGQSVRLADVPAARAFGVFDHLSGFPTGAALADHLKTASITHHGHAGRAYLERLTRESRNLSEFLERFKALPEFSPDGAQGQIRRVAGRFALLALAGELATEYGVTGWPEGEAIRAAAVGFELWRNTRDTGNGETRQIIEAVSRFLDRHADSRFSNIKESADGSHEAMRYDRAGYFTDEGPGRAYLFNADGLHAALKGFDFRRALDVLEQAGALAKSPNGERTRSYRTPGGVKRLYPIIAERLEVGHGT